MLRILAHMHQEVSLDVGWHMGSHIMSPTHPYVEHPYCAGCEQLASTTLYMHHTLRRAPCRGSTALQRSTALYSALQRSTALQLYIPLHYTSLYHPPQLRRGEHFLL